MFLWFVGVGFVAVVLVFKSPALDYRVVAAGTWHDHRLLVLEPLEMSESMEALELTAPVVRAIADGAPNLRVISLLRNFGCYYARNIGLLNAQGAFVTMIDSDDIMER